MERDFDKEMILKESKAVNQEYLECVAMNSSLDDLRTELQIKYHYLLVTLNHCLIFLCPNSTMKIASK